MAAEVVPNNASTSLVGTITGSVTSITVSSAALFPATGQYRILVDNELMLVTGGQGTTTWTVTRGIESTTATTHTAATIYGVITGGALGNLGPSGSFAAIKPAGLTGATSPSRYVGATSSGPPGGGTFVTGDWITDQSGNSWVCVTGGSPGSWKPLTPGRAWNARIYMSGASGLLSAGIWTQVPFTSGEYDSTGSQNTTGANAKISVGGAGLYAVSANVGFTTASGVADGTRYIAEIVRTVNGGTPTVDVGAYRFLDVQTGASYSSGGGASGSGTAHWNLGAGDQLTLWAWCSSATAAINGGSDAEGGGVASTSLSAVCIG